MGHQEQTGWILRLTVYCAVAAILFGGCTGKPSSENARPVHGERTGELNLTDHGGLPENSIYQFEGTWHTQYNDTIQLKQLQGKIPVVAMVFTHCEFACPRIITDMKKIRKEIPPEKEDEMVFVLVSFDSERDQPERLKAYAEEVKLDENWLLLHGNEENVRMLSMLLDVNFQKQPGGTFAHSNIITLLNKTGEIVTQVDGLGMDASPILSRIRNM